MKRIPVYGFEQNYEVDEKGNIYSKAKNTLKKPAPQASSRQNRYRLNDGKYYDGKYLVYKSFNPDLSIEINDERIIFIDGKSKNDSLDNLKFINKNDRGDIALSLSEKYQERILPVPEYKNYYLSENGNLYSYYNTTSKKIKLYIGTDGYYQTKIPDNFGADYHFKIHRWVALLFVKNPKPNEYNIVHHKNENKLDNNYLNLEWTTLKQNTVYSLGKKCCMLNKYNCILSIHDSVADLSRYYRVDSSTASKQCRGTKNQFANGYKARFFDDNIHNFVATKFD